MAALDARLSAHMRERERLLATLKANIAVDAAMQAVVLQGSLGRPDPSEMTTEGVRHARFGMVPITAKFFARGSRDRLLRLLAGIGAEAPDDDPTSELAVMRERLRVLQPGESSLAIEAVDALIHATEEFRATGPEQ